MLTTLKIFFYRKNIKLAIEINPTKFLDTKIIRFDIVKA